MYLSPLVRPRRHRGWGPGGVPIVDWTHPITAKMTSCLYPIAPGVLVDVSRQRPFGTGGTPAFGPKGTAATGTITIGDATNSTDLDWTGGPFTVMVWGNVSESVNTGWELNVNTTFRFHIFRNNGSANYAPPAIKITYSAGEHLFGGASDGSTTRYTYLDTTIASTATGNITPVSSANALISAHAAGSRIYVGWTWSRLLSSEERFSLYKDPWQFLIFPGDFVRSYYSGAAAPVPYNPWPQAAPILAQ